MLVSLLLRMSIDDDPTRVTNSFHKKNTFVFKTRLDKIYCLKVDNS